MTELIDSIVVESNKKRLPKTKSGRLLVSVRNHIVDNIKSEVKQNKLYDPHKDRKRIKIVEQLNRRINSRFIKEDEEAKTQLSLFEMEGIKSNYDKHTHERTVVEFKEFGDIIRAEFTGNIEEAKANLRRHRGVVVIRYAHYTKDNPLTIRGMWSDLVCVNKPEMYQVGF